MDELHSYLDIAELVGKFLKGEMTEQERMLLNAWIAQSTQNRAFWEKLTLREYLEQQLESWEEGNPEAAWQELLPAIRSARLMEARPTEARPVEAGLAEAGSIERNPIEPLSRRPANQKYVWSAAALVIILAGTVTYRSMHRTVAPEAKQVATLAALPRIPPGKHTAQLVLSTGKVVGLGAGGIKKINEADGASVENDLNVLKYARAGVNLKDEACFNTVITPRGGEYQLVLSDGTKVWLNAASSIRYPVCFTGKERRVNVVGEAFFQVAKDADHPFVVTTRQSDITVLGTSFNIKAYPDESCDKTSLVEGLVKVSAAGPSAAAVPDASAAKDALLRPGTQAVVESGRGIAVGMANLEEALAWKNGLFVFQSESLECITRKLSRWYNVDIVFEDNHLRNIHFTGRVRRYDDMNVILNMIGATSRATFSRQGLQVIVGMH